MPPEPVSNSWAEYQRLVLAELERHSKGIESLNTQMNELKTEIATRNELAAIKAELNEYKVETASDLATLKTRAAGWGALAGALASLVPILMVFLLQLISKGRP